MPGIGEQTPTPPPIDSLSEQELRIEIADRINATLGNISESPVADGTGVSGFNRREQGLPSLRCAYFQFSKTLGKTEGVQINLLGLFDSTRLYIREYRERIGNLLRIHYPLKEDDETLDSFKQSLKKMKQPRVYTRGI